MRRLGIALLLAVAVAAPASAAPPLLVTGRLKALDMTKVTVGRTTCALRTKSAAARAGVFAVGERVTIACARGTLKTIVLAPVASGPGHSLPGVHASVTVPTPNDAKPTLAWSGGVLATAAPSTGSSSSSNAYAATGAVSALDATGLTVSGLTCPFYGANLTPEQQTLARLEADKPNGVYQRLLAMHVAAGVTVAMSCTFSDGSSSGRVTVG